MDDLNPFLVAHYAVTDFFLEHKNSVRNLIGSAHWLTDGEHKESLVRKVLRSQLPTTARVCRGFVHYTDSRIRWRGRPVQSSSQLDVLVIGSDVTPLFEDGDLVIVRPQDVQAVIEVKTRLNLRWAIDDISSDQAHPKRFANVELGNVLLHFARQIAHIRFVAREQGVPPCWAGVFVYNRSPQYGVGRQHEILLRALQEVTQGQQERVIDCIALGTDMFSHFWNHGRNEVGSIHNGPVWHTYEIPHLAHPYLLSNLLFHMTKPEDAHIPEHYFPIPDGKEMYRRYFVPLESDVVRSYE